MRKPLIERKRRERINNCLDQLKETVIGVFRLHVSPFPPFFGRHGGGREADLLSLLSNPNWKKRIFWRWQWNTCRIFRTLKCPVRHACCFWEAALHTCRCVDAWVRSWAHALKELAALCTFTTRGLYTLYTHDIFSFTSRSNTWPGGPAEIQHRVHSVHARGPQHASHLRLDGQDSGLQAAQPPPQITAQVHWRLQPEPAQTRCPFRCPSAIRVGHAPQRAPQKATSEGGFAPSAGGTAGEARTPQQSSEHDGDVEALVKTRAWMILVIRLVSSSGVMYLIDMQLRRQKVGRFCSSHYIPRITFSLYFPEEGDLL